MSDDDPERCLHQMLPGTCSICNTMDGQSLLSEVFDEVNAETAAGGSISAETESVDDGPADTDTAVVLTKICVRAGCSHGGKFQEIGCFEDGNDVCRDCPDEGGTMEENAKPPQPQQERWSDDDIEFLRLNVDEMSNSELGESLGRTAGAVGYRLTAHDIKRKKRKRGKRGNMDENGAFDVSKYYLGKLCKYGHEFKDTGKSLRRKNSRSCVECLSQARTQLSPDKLIVDFADHPDIFQALLDQAKEELREPAQEVIYILRKLQRLGTDE